MRKYIKSKSGNLVYTIERQSFSETFRTPENYFTHATRNVWYSTTGFNMFVQYKGAFYMIDRTDAHGYITSLEFTVITAEEAAAAKMERAAQAMSEAQEHEAKTAAAALDYDTETAEAEAREARFCADYAAALAKDAAELAAEAGTSEAASIADAASEYAERASRYATSAVETAEQNAAELAERAEIIAAVEDPEEYAEYMEQAEQQAAPEYIEPEHIQTVSGHKIYRSIDPVTGWNVFTVAGRDFWELAEARYFAQCNPAEQAEPAKHHDDHAAELAAVEAAAPEALASEGNPEDAVNLIAYTAFACINDGATPDTYYDNDMEQLDRLMGYATEIVKRDGPAYGIEWEPYQVCEFEAEQAAETAAEHAKKARELSNIARDATRPTYQRAELLAYLGEPDDYDVTAIEHDATAYDAATGRTVWAVDAETLAAIAERHELYSYSPAEDEPEPDEINAYMRRQAFGDYSHADATTREEMEAAALKFAAQEQTRLVALWQEAGARQARERYEPDEATARDLMNLQDAGAITAEDVASYYQRHGWTPRKYHRN